MNLVLLWLVWMIIPIRSGRLDDRVSSQLRLPKRKHTSLCIHIFFIGTWFVWHTHAYTSINISSFCGTPFSCYTLPCVISLFLLKKFWSYPFSIKALSWPSSLSLPSRLSKWEVHTCIQQGFFIYWPIGTCEGSFVEGQLYDLLI